MKNSNLGVWAALASLCLGACTSKIAPRATGGGTSAATSGSGTDMTGGTTAGTGGTTMLTPDELEEAENDSSICVPGVPGTTQLPRLSRLQYDNTVRDLLHVDIQPSSMLAPDSDGSVDQRAWDGYKQAAAALAAAVMADADARGQVIGCTPDGDGTACAQELARELGRRAFRRPLGAEDVARYDALIARRSEVTESNTFDELAELIIEMTLLAPSFVVRAELAEQPEGQYFALDGYEVANRLSYLLWNSMPDDMLFAAAEAGELASSEGILAQAERMLGDPRARAMVEGFHEHYMEMGPGTRWDEINRDPALYPNYDISLSPLLSEETMRFVDYVVFELQGSFQDLVLQPVGFVNADLAPLYGLDPASFGQELVATPLDTSQRAGIFTRLGFLASHAYYDRSSPIHRGAFLQKKVLCAPIGTPPPGAESQPLPTEGLVTNRERTDAQTAASGCAACHHTFINPTGFPFESFDGVGAYQTTESFSGATIDTSAMVPIGAEVVAVDGAVSLSEAIAAAPEAHGCYAQKWVEYAYNRAINNQDSCVVEQLQAKLTAGGYTILNLVADLTQSEQFRLRALEPEAGQ